jgi:hypothetical protein
MTGEMTGVLETASQCDLRYRCASLGVLQHFPRAFQPDPLGEIRRRIAAVFLELPEQAPGTDLGNGRHRLDVDRPVPVRLDEFLDGLDRGRTGCRWLAKQDVCIIVLRIHEKTHDRDARHLSGGKFGKQGTACVEVGRELENHTAHASHRRVPIVVIAEYELVFDRLPQQRAEIALQRFLVDAEHQVAVARFEIEAKRDAGRPDPGARSPRDLAVQILA